MRNSLFLLAAASMVALLSVGCAGPEKKLGRGLNNVGEVVRWGEMRREIEQAGVWSGSQSASGGGYISGFNKSISRIAVGAFEVITFPIPIPSYDPVFTSYLTPAPAFPDSYQPGIKDNSIFNTDTYMGFSGGDIIPIMPGSRFAIFRSP